MGTPLQELTIKNHFMFAAVMLQGDNCKELLEMVTGIKIAKITVLEEKTIVYNPECKGVRFDIEAKDEDHTHYDVELQINRKEILLRSRYYHSQMDMELLATGTPYERLPKSYVIFICDYDPFDLKKYRYTITPKCEEAPELDVSTGMHTIFLSTKGENDSEIPEALRKFLKYVGSSLEDSEDDFQDQYVEKLQQAVRKVKKDRKLGERYMVIQEMLDEEREEGKKEGIKLGEVKGRVNDIKYLLEEKNIHFTELVYSDILLKRDLELTHKLFGAAVKVQTKEEYQRYLDEVGIKVEEFEG